MWYETLIPRILNMTMTGSLVIGIVLLCRLLLCRAPRILSYSLWSVVLFRLLCPFSFSAGASLLSLFHVPATESSTIEYIPTDIASAPYPRVDFLVDIASDAVNSSLPQGWEQVETQPLANVFCIAAWIWLAVAAGLAVCSLMSLLRLRRSLSRAAHLKENIYITDRLGTAIVIGLLRPRIYLPASLSCQEQEHVLLHESHHIRRLDPWFRLLAFAALCIHWFNPLVWLAFFLSERDMEMSCDEAVVQNMDRQQRCDYSQSLLRLAAGRRLHPVSPLSFCEGNPSGRIRNILRWRRPSALSYRACLCVCLLLCVSLAADPVVAVDPGVYQTFRGRISFKLPEGYDYFLLEAPKSGNGNPDIVIYRTESQYPVCDGCISLNFSRSVYTGFTNPITELPPKKYCSGNAGQYPTLSKRSLTVPELGSLQVTTYNEMFWTAEDYAQYSRLMDSITVISHEDPVYFNLDQDSAMTVGMSEVSDYFLYTDNHNLCVYLSGAKGSASVTLYEAYTGLPVRTFSTDNASSDDHWAFTGLSIRKAYYLRVTGAEGARITIFRKEE